MHDIRNVPLAGSPAVASRPAEAARCLESRASTRTRVYHPNMPGFGENFLHTQQAHINDGRNLLLAPCASLEVECKGLERSAQPQRRMDVPNA
jgi:hypothetical protein